MSVGEPSPWAASYSGPWSPAVPPTGPTPDQRHLGNGNFPTVSPPGWSYGLERTTDADLRRLPPPLPGARARDRTDETVQRPAVIAVSVCLSVTAGLLWVGGLSLGWLVALAGTRSISPVGDDGVVFHTLDEFVLRMGDGLWLPLYGFPLLAVASAFCLLGGRPWARIAHSAVGVTALGWAAWWLRDSVLTWLVVAVYVGTAVAIMWVRPVGRWYAGRPRTPRPGDVVLRG